MEAISFNSKTFTLGKTKIENNNVWSVYHKNYSPLTNNAKNIMIKIENQKVRIISNTLDNFFKDEDLNLEDLYFIYKLR